MNSLSQQHDACFGAGFKGLTVPDGGLNLAIVGLEAGFILMYKAGWSVSTGQIVSSAFLAAVLIVIGKLLYNKAITVHKCLGAAICLAGLYLINK